MPSSVQRISIRPNHGLRFQRITSLSRARFDELLAQIMDGSLQQRWDKLDEANMTKSQAVEARQVKAVCAVYIDAPETFHQLQHDKTWKTLEVLKSGDKVYLRAVLPNKHITNWQRRSLCHR